MLAVFQSQGEENWTRRSPGSGFFLEIGSSGNNDLEACLYHFNGAIMPFKLHAPWSWTAVLRCTEGLSCFMRSDVNVISPAPSEKYVWLAHKRRFIVFGARGFSTGLDIERELENECPHTGKGPFLTSATLGL